MNFDRRSLFGCVFGVHKKGIIVVEVVHSLVSPLNAAARSAWDAI
jgi:hypothetical protein